MARYHCPFCSNSYQLHIENEKGKMICGHCGDELVQRRIIGPVRIFSLIIVIVLLSPVITSLFIILNEHKKQEAIQDDPLLACIALYYRS